MGMEIDEALKVWLPVIQMGVETMPECKESLDMAISMMRKYQKIEQIIKEIPYGGDATVRRIQEVIEDEM